MAAYPLATGWALARGPYKGVLYYVLVCVCVRACVCVCVVCVACAVRDTTCVLEPRLPGANNAFDGQIEFVAGQARFV